ncbi:MAG: TolC family protein [Spirochaetaceae bacterium]|jgi:outer membrane protein TolC|nr:TolC family protein [Spirochaetaceae bacterium]
MKIKMYVLFLALVPRIFAQEAGASRPVSITPDKAVEMAIENNLSIKQAQIANEAKRRNAKTPWNQLIPTVDVAGTLGRSNIERSITGFVPVPIPGYPIYGVMPYSVDAPQWFLSGSLQVALNLNVAIYAALVQIKEEYQAGKVTIEKAKLQMERDIRKAYYNMLLAKERISLLQESYANAGRQVTMAQANYRAGLIPEVSLLQVQVARENMKPQIDEAENAYRMAMASFAMFLGLPYNAEFELVSLPGNAAFIVLEAQALISQAAANKPDIEELRRTLAALKAQKTLLFYSLYTPTLSLGFTMDPAFQGDPWKDNWFKGDLWKQQSGMFRITLAWRLNALLPFSKEANDYKAMEDAVKAMELGMFRAIQGTEVEVYNIILQLEKTRTTAEAQRLTVELAERTLRLSETAYRNGLKQFIEVQNDELALRQARLGSLQQNYTYLMGLLDLEYALGVPFGSLSAQK